MLTQSLRLNPGDAAALTCRCSLARASEGTTAVSRASLLYAGSPTSIAEHWAGQDTQTFLFGGFVFCFKAQPARGVGQDCSQADPRPLHGKPGADAHPGMFS